MLEQSTGIYIDGQEILTFIGAKSPGARLGAYIIERRVASDAVREIVRQAKRNGQRIAATPRR